MIAKAAKNAIWIALGTTVGLCILPRMLFQGSYGDTWPPVWKEALLYFATGYIAAFSVLLLIYRIQAALRKGKPPHGRSDNAEERKVRALFVSELPADVDWDEVNAFLRTTKFYKELLLDDWRRSETFAAYPISDTSIECMRSLHEDLANCYRGAFAFCEDGREDRGEEYRLLREQLYLKYGRIDAELLERIYLHYLQEDR